MTVKKIKKNKEKAVEKLYKVKSPKGIKWDIDEVTFETDTIKKQLSYGRKNKEKYVGERIDQMGYVPNDATLEEIAGAYNDVGVPAEIKRVYWIDIISNIAMVIVFLILAYYVINTL